MNLATQNRRSRLNLYRAAGLGGVALAGVVTSADASIVFINFNSQVLADTTPGTGFTPTGLGFDLNGDGTNDLRLAVNVDGGNGLALVTIPAAGTTLDVVGNTVGIYNYPSRLAAGANIGPAATFVTLQGVNFASRGSLANGVGYSNSQWTNNASPAFLGFRFSIGGAPVYAWLQIAVASNAGGRAITILNGAYETNGTAISAGAIPEPSTSVGLLALGAAGLLAHRRRRAAA